MGAWLTQLVAPYFLNPAIVAGGVALAAAPVIIHLLNRLRFRRVPFAAMEFLLASEQKNRRRILLEQLLLLLLRVLIVLILVALVARLILDPSKGVLFGGAKAHHVVLLDDSGSMNNRWGETSAFEEAKTVVKRLVAEGARRPQTQTFSLILLSQPDGTVISQADVDDRLVTALEQRFENLRATQRSLDLAEGLKSAGQLLAEDRAVVKHLHVISDFRRANWEDQPAVGSEVRRLHDAGVFVNLVRTVPERHENLAVTDLSGEVQVAAAGIPLRLNVSVRNFGEKIAENVRLSVFSDGTRLPMTIGFDRIEAGAEVSRTFYVTFEQPGHHWLRVELEADALVDDNVRYLAVDIPASNQVLVIDGDPAGVEAQYVADALGDAATTGFAPIVETVDYLRRRPLDPFHTIYLLNVPEIPPDAILPLEAYVRGGGGLAWFLGDAVNPAHYNDALLERRLFPVPLAPARAELPRDELDPSPDLTFARHPMFELFAGEDNPFTEIVNVYAWLPAADDWVRDDNERRDGVTTIARLRNRQPFVFEHQLGRGRIVTCLSSAGPVWNNWASGPGNASFVITLLEMEKHIGRRDQATVRRVVGAPIHAPLDPAVYTDEVVVTAPVAGAERTVVIKAAPEANSGQAGESGADGPADREAEEPLRYVATFGDTDRTGVYKVRLLRHDSSAEETWIAYNVPIDQSDLELASNARIRERIGEDLAVPIHEPGQLAWIEGRPEGQEIKHLLIALLVAVLIAEQALAYRLSYHPTTAGAAV